MQLLVNGTSHDVSPDPDRPLLHVLREELDLTGTKLACGEGVCGACSVLVDGTPLRACVTPLSQVAGRAVTTIEGVAQADGLHPLQRAFLDEGAFQCGFCTPGMIITAAALLEASPHPTPSEVRSALDGNICRCGTYPRILGAIERATQSTAAPARPGARRIDGLPPSFPEPWDISSDHAALWAWLGDGLLVVSEDGTAWLHVGANGLITVASGKVDVGQGSTAELAGVVVAHLGAAPASVRLLLGDTDLAPYDRGTFGSRTTPEVVPAVAGVASAARAALTAVAAGEWSLEAASVAVRDGMVATADGTRAATFAELVRGLRRVETTSPAPPTAGTTDVVVDAADIVTGRRRFTSDLKVPGMLHGCVLRPPAPGGALLDLDTTDAEAIDGARIVRDADLVGVVAPDALTAGRALAAVRARWSATSGPSSVMLDAYLRAHPSTADDRRPEVDEVSGDPDSVLQAAPVRLAATYSAAYIAHDPLETRAAVARWEDDGRLTVWTGSQRPFAIREALAEALGLGEDRIRVIVPATGGAYGGKHTPDAALEAARLARAVGRPVRVRWTREEEMAWGYARPAAVVDVRSAAEPDGTLAAWEFTNINAGPHSIEPPYRIPNLRLRFQPADGPLRVGAYRALSATANTFARESHLDEIAHALGADPLELRLRHIDDERLAAVLREAAAAAGWPGVHGEGRALGLACGREKNSRVATVVAVQATPGKALRVERIVTAFDCGRIIDPHNLRNQVMGAHVMALGGALYEALELSDGRVANVRQSQYRVPRFSDVPAVEVILVDRPDLPSAGAGETPMIAIAPAVANAIFAACGMRLRSMPLVPEGRIPPAG